MNSWRIVFRRNGTQKASRNDIFSRVPQNCTTINDNHRKLPLACVQAEYLCKDGITCIHRSWVCDGETDCPGGDDEMMPNCQNITCRADQYQCADKSCIAGHFHCSGKAECRDGSDELNCRKHLWMSLGTLLDGEKLGCEMGMRLFIHSAFRVPRTDSFIY